MQSNKTRAIGLISLLVVVFTLMTTMQAHTVAAQNAAPAATSVSTMDTTMSATMNSATTSATLSATMNSTMSATTSATFSATMQMATPLVTSLTGDPKKAAYIRALHVAPDAPAVDFYAGAQIIASNIPFAGDSNYLPVAPGSVTLAVRPAGAAITSKPLGTLDVYLPTGVSATFAATGLVNGSGPTAFKIVVITSDRSPTKGKARIEVFHAAPAVGTIDVLVDGSAKLTEIKFTKPGNSPLNVPPAVYHLSLVATGAKTPALIDAPNTTLAADMIYTLVAVSPLNGTPKALIVAAPPLPPS